MVGEEGGGGGWLDSVTGVSRERRVLVYGAKIDGGPVCLDAASGK